MKRCLSTILAGVLTVMVCAAPAEVQSIAFEDKLNIREGPSAYTVTFDMRGFDQESVDIDITPTFLTVKGEYSRQESGQNPNAYFQTRQYGSFAKTIPIPDDADTSRLRTEKQDEQLIITLPKRNQIPDVQESRENQRLQKFRRIAYFQV